MKTSAVGVVSAAILMVVVGVGFGIAQAGGSHSEQPVLSFEDMEALTTQVANSSEEFVPEGNWSGTDWQAREAIETAGLPAEGNAEFDPFSRGGP